MSKKRNRKKLPAGSDVVWRQSAEEATLAAKPLYNGFACGYGAHGSKKYRRCKAKQAWQKQIRQEGAPRGSFLFLEDLGFCSGVWLPWPAAAGMFFPSSGLIRSAWMVRFAIMALEEKGRAL